MVVAGEISPWLVPPQVPAVKQPQVRSLEKRKPRRTAVARRAVRSLGGGISLCLHTAPSNAA